MKNLIITTSVGETNKFTTLNSFLFWDNNINKDLITEYEVEYMNGNKAGNKGVNAGANLYELLKVN